MFGKHLRIIFLLLFVDVVLVRAQTTNDPTITPFSWQGMSVGVEIGSIAGNLTQSLRVASPSFWHGRARVALAGTLAWLQDARGINDKFSHWFPFGIIKLGVHAGDFMLDMPIRISIFADVNMAIPTLKISHHPVVFGLNAGIDHEIFLEQFRKHAVFIALGGSVLFQPTAFGIRDFPTFGTGFTSAVGYRYYF